MKVKVIKSGKEYEVQFSYGVQYFTLQYKSKKNEAMWMAKMLRACFKSYTESIKKS